MLSTVIILLLVISDFPTPEILLGFPEESHLCYSAAAPLAKVSTLMGFLQKLAQKMFSFTTAVESFTCVRMYHGEPLFITARQGDWFHGNFGVFHNLCKFKLSPR